MHTHGFLQRLVCIQTFTVWGQHTRKHLCLLGSYIRRFDVTNLWGCDCTVSLCLACGWAALDIVAALYLRLKRCETWDLTQPIFLVPIHMRACRLKFILSFFFFFLMLRGACGLAVKISFSFCFLLWCCGGEKKKTSHVLSCHLSYFIWREYLEKITVFTKRIRVRSVQEKAAS